MYEIFFKRILDVILAGVALIVFSPLMLMVALAIYLEDGGPALFQQVRVCRGGESFRLLKFRSMPVSTENVPSSKAGSLKVTRVGKFIRRTNIDELPQLINILVGNMGIVGPRPALSVQEELCNMRKANGAIKCRPGLTGLTQVNSYDGMSDLEKAMWDGKYAKEMSFCLDLKIIFRTFTYLTRRPPVY